MMVPPRKPQLSPFAQAAVQDVVTRAPVMPASPFAADPMSVESVGSTSGLSSSASNARSEPLELSAAPHHQPAPKMPERTADSDSWRLGAVRGSKHKPSAKLRGLHAKHLSQARKAHTHLPPIFVSELRSQSGQTYLMTQTLTQGAQGKFRICSKEHPGQGPTQFYGVKEYRLTHKDAQHTAPIHPEDILAEWHIADAHGQQLSNEHGKMQVLDMILQNDDKVLVITNLHDRNVGDSLHEVKPEDMRAYGRVLILQVASHLKALHAQKVLHRDVKPANLFLGEKGAVLGDFGHARPLKDGTVQELGGTPAFMPEEAVFFAPVGAGADAWSLAMTWCAMHRLPTPFNTIGLEGGNMMRARGLFQSYAMWHEQLQDGRGKVDVSRLGTKHAPAIDETMADMEVPGQSLTDYFDDWNAWGEQAKAADPEMFEHLLNGPAHPDSAKRPSMADEVKTLESMVSPADLSTFKTVVSELRDSASYALQPKSSEKSSTSSPRASYPLKVIQEDLQAFARALADPESSKT